jgi:ornithine cyclodeaminase/alanine dehydrogenase-like protein (mu-crystallin family)
MTPPGDSGGLSIRFLSGPDIDELGLTSELGLLTLYDPDTGIPLSIMDATMITACRTGADIAVGALILSRARDAGAGTMLRYR